MKTFYIIYLLGIFLPSNAKRIVNGEDAVLGQFPYQVLWAMESDGDFYVNCGGSDIHVCIIWSNIAKRLEGLSWMQ